jgi:4-hydroxythreonine-4-phosphate dehydrogenase
VIAEKCECKEYSMSLISDKLIVPHVTSHVSLKEAIGRLSKERILFVIRLAHEAAVKLKRGTRIAVMGLNPHAGESGAFGDEEIKHIQPAIQAAKAEGIDAIGPVPPDTAFMRALHGDFQAIVCMYHDQGHIPMKTIGMDEAVNVTLGLPIVRTSVDHGTAFDIAYKGVASISSFIKALDLGDRLSKKDI